MQNAVIEHVNKQAKLEYGEGTQVSCSVGDRLSMKTSNSNRIHMKLP